MTSRPSDRYPALSVSVESGQQQPIGHFQHQPRSPYNHLAVRSPGPRSPPPGSPPLRTPRPFPQFQQNQPRPLHPSAFSQAHAQPRQPRPFSHQYPNQHPHRPPPSHGTTVTGYPPVRPYVHSTVLTESYPSAPAPVFSSHNVVIPSRNSSTYNPSTAVSSPPRSLSNSSGTGSASSTATIISPAGLITYRPGPPSQQQRQQRPHWSPSSATLDPTTDHPLALGPPNPRFAQQASPNYRQVRPRIQQQPASRPGSVASNFSTSSNEPLHQSPRASPSSARGLSTRNNSSMTTSSSKSTKVTSVAGGSYRGNHLDLPEERTKAGQANVARERRSSTSSSTHSSDSTRSRTGKAKKSKIKGRLLSRLGRICRGPQPYNPEKYKMTSMGKMAQFSNERLYLHWIRFGVLQGSIAVLLLSFGIGVASYVGVGAIVLALLTLIYSTTLYHTRHMNMVNKRKDVKYFARAIPTLLTLGLLVLYGWNFVVIMTYPKETWIPPPWTQNDDANFMNYF
ncbi:hypothetical protein BGZ67_003691 [Mortierella alpina]|nr:hypothetical protein BGZ67_003691 [Mortierella alpina]